jgi:hypothetical protein
MAKLRKVIPLAAILLLAALVLPAAIVHRADATAYPDDVWVATTGNNSNAGTEAAPFATIQWGIDHVASDNVDSPGIVHVAAGTYHENLHIPGATNLLGAGAHYTIIDGGGTGQVIEIGSLSNTPNTISGFTIQGGNSAGQGGGIYIGETHIVTINDCTIKDNEALQGGGIYNEGELFMDSCTISGNSAFQAGGGIFNNRYSIGGLMVLNNCTISGNQILSNQDGTVGAGIANVAFVMFLLECTVANNTSIDPGSLGGGFYNASLAIFSDTIVANNKAGHGNNGYSVVTPFSGGHNLSSDNSCGFNQPTDLINTDPLLGPLQDNGGPTFTHALLHGSPAIDHSECGIIIDPATQNLINEAANGLSINIASQIEPVGLQDQRGVPRPQGAACDIGAYELAQASADTSTNKGTASFSTLNGYITDLRALNAGQTNCGALPNYDFPFGLFSFNVNDITPGSTATVVLILPSNAPTNIQYWKCLNRQWVDCTSLLGSNDGDQVLTLSITDGGLGDGDGQANGRISDPGGPALSALTPTHPSVSPSLPRLLNPPQMSVQYLNVSPKQATANQPVTISTNVVNTGDQAGNLNIALKINGQVEQTRMVSVGPKTSQPVKFTVTKSQPGTYSIDIGGQTGSFTIPGSSNTAPVSGGLIVFLIIGVLVLAAVLVLVLTRKPA